MKNTAIHHAAQKTLSKSIRDHFATAAARGETAEMAIATLGIMLDIIEIAPIIEVDEISEETSEKQKKEWEDGWGNFSG